MSLLGDRIGSAMSTIPSMVPRRADGTKGVHCCVCVYRAHQKGKVLSVLGRNSKCITFQEAALGPALVIFPVSTFFSWGKPLGDHPWGTSPGGPPWAPPPGTTPLSVPSAFLYRKH